MSRTQESRLTKLEQTGDGRPIIVWCDDPAQVESRIADMIERGEIAAGDRDRVLFVHWRNAASTPAA